MQQGIVLAPVAQLRPLATSLPLIYVNALLSKHALPHQTDTKAFNSVSVSEWEHCSSNHLYLTSIALLRKHDPRAFKNDLISAMQTRSCTLQKHATSVCAHKWVYIMVWQISYFVLIITYRSDFSHPSDWLPWQHWPDISTTSIRWLRNHMWHKSAVFVLFNIFYQ